MPLSITDEQRRARLGLRHHLAGPATDIVTVAGTWVIWSRDCSTATATLARRCGWMDASSAADTRITPGFRTPPERELVEEEALTDRFTGFGSDAITFFDELESNNTREWFQANKSTWEGSIRDPLRALVAELEPELGGSKIFRINRDIRFSADKSPYKTWAAAVIGGNYFSLSSEGMYAGGGFYMPEPVYLKRFRAAVADDRTGPELEGVLTTLRRKRYEVTTHEKLKTAPRGYTSDHPRIDLLRHKDLTAGRGWAPGAWLSTREPVERIKKVYADLKPFKEWLAANVG